MNIADLDLIPRGMTIPLKTGCPMYLCQYSSHFAMSTTRTPIIWKLCRSGQGRLFEVEEYGSCKMQGEEHGSSWPNNKTWVKLPTRAQLGHNYFSPTWVQHGATWARSDTSWV